MGLVGGSAVVIAQVFPVSDAQLILARDNSSGEGEKEGSFFNSQVQVCESNGINRPVCATLGLPSTPSYSLHNILRADAHILQHNRVSWLLSRAWNLLHPRARIDAMLLFVWVESYPS